MTNELATCHQDARFPGDPGGGGNEADVCEIAAGDFAD
jgi:hypothetical protein